jgi:hypothetical protein
MRSGEIRAATDPRRGLFSEEACFTVSRGRPEVGSIQDHAGSAEADLAHARGDVSALEGVLR